MHQDVRQRVQRSEQWSADPAIRTSTQPDGDLGGRQLRTAPRQLVDCARDASATKGPPHEGRGTVRDGTDDMGGHRLDITARAQARCRQLRVVQTVQQASDLAPLVGDGGELCAEIAAMAAIGAKITTPNSNLGVDN